MVVLENLGVNILLLIINSYKHKKGHFLVFKGITRARLDRLSLRYPYVIPTITLLHGLVIVFYRLPLRIEVVGFYI